MHRPQTLIMAACADPGLHIHAVTQDVWCAFLIYLALSRFGKMKLGGDDEKPRYNDFTWFCMLFTCGSAQWLPQNARAFIHGFFL